MYRVVFIFALFLHYTCIIRALPTYGLVIREKSGALKKVFIIAVRSSRTSYRFRSLHFSCSRNSPYQKGSKQSVLSFRFTGVQLHSFTHCLHLLAGSQGGLCKSGARSNASTVSCSRSRSGRRKAKKQSICHTLRFVQLPVSAGGPSLQ